MKKKMKYLKYVFLILYILSFSYHCFSSVQSANESASLSMSITEVVVEIEEKVFNIEVNDIDKVHNNVRKIIGHYMYFGLIGTFGFFTFYFFSKKLKNTLIFSLSIGLLMATTSEVLQNFGESRGPSAGDVIIDYGGYVTATLGLLLIFYLILRRKSKKDESLEE